MKKILGLFLCLTLTSPFLLSYFWYIYSKQSIRQEVRQKILPGLETNSLILLSFPTIEAEKKLRWEKPGEFEYKGQMYDVVKMKITKDSVHYVCYQDKAETSLNLRINKIIAMAMSQDSQNRETQKRLTSFFQSFYLQDHFQWNSDIPLKNLEGRTDKYFICSSVYLAPVAPPPKLS